MNLKVALKYWIFRKFSRSNQKKWKNVEAFLSSKGKFKLYMYISSLGPHKKSALVDYMMKSGQYNNRASCIRVVNRLLEKMIKERSVSVDDKGNFSINRESRLMIGKYPSYWITLGLGASIIFIGLGVIDNNIPLIACGISFLIYSLAVVLSYLIRLSPY